MVLVELHRYKSIKIIKACVCRSERKRTIQKDVQCNHFNAPQQEIFSLSSTVCILTHIGIYMIMHAGIRVVVENVSIS